MGIILVTTEASITCMYVRMYVGRRKKNYRTPRREGKGGEGKGKHGKGVTLEEKEDTKRKIKTHLNELTHNSSLHCNRVLSNDYDRPLSNVRSLLQVKAPVTITKRQRQYTKLRGKRKYTHSVMQSYKNL